MSFLYSASLFINVFLVAMALLNAITIIRPGKKQSDSLGFSLLVPCRNEEENIEELVKYLGALDHPQYEVIFINDNSTDGTRQLINEAISNRSNMSLIDAEPLPQGWMGKPWALSQGLTSARFEYIVTVDADVRLRSDALSSIDSILTKTKLDDYGASAPGHEELSPITCCCKWTVLLHQKERTSCSRWLRSNSQKRSRRH
jgi:cellulose synthase/poly-beta-1,6-N-acetylglucosamine synthase-like glycosyltransferase